MTRKKLMMVGASQDVLWSFLTAFFTPYIMNDINAHIGYIFAAIQGLDFCTRSSCSQNSEGDHLKRLKSSLTSLDGAGSSKRSRRRVQER